MVIIKKTGLFIGLRAQALNDAVVDGYKK